MSTLIYARSQGAWTADDGGVRELRRMLEDSLRLDDAVERLERLEHATDMLLRTLDRVVGRRSLPFQLKLGWRRSSNSSTP